MDNVDRAIALHDESEQLRERGEPRRAAAIARRAIRLLEKIEGKNHPDVANALLTLGRAQEQGDAWRQASQSYEKAAAIMTKYRRYRNPDIRRLHVKVARARCGVARVLVQYDRADRHGRRAIELAERWFGSSDLDLAGALNDLGMVRKYQGRYADAERLYRRSLAILRAARLGQSDDAASIHHNLGGVAHAQGRYARAERPARRAVALREKSGRLPAIAADVAALAAVLEGRGKLAEATACYRRALRIFRRLFGPRCYEVGVNLAGLAGIHHARGRYDQAIDLYRQSYAMHCRLLGDGHFDVAVTLNNLASSLASSGDVRNAVHVAKRALHAFRRSIGSRHPTTIGCEEHVAQLEQMARSR